MSGKGKYTRSKSRHGPLSSLSGALPSSTLSSGGGDEQSREERESEILVDLGNPDNERQNFDEREVASTAQGSQRRVSANADEVFVRDENVMESERSRRVETETMGESLIPQNVVGLRFGNPESNGEHSRIHRTISRGPEDLRVGENRSRPQSTQSQHSSRPASRNSANLDLMEQMARVAIRVFEDAGRNKEQSELQRREEEFVGFNPSGLQISGQLRERSRVDELLNDERVESRSSRSSQRQEVPSRSNGNDLVVPRPLSSTQRVVMERNQREYLEPRSTYSCRYKPKGYLGAKAPMVGSLVSKYNEYKLDENGYKFLYVQRECLKQYPHPREEAFEYILEYEDMRYGPRPVLFDDHMEYYYTPGRNNPPLSSKYFVDAHEAQDAKRFWENTVFPFYFDIRKCDKRDLWEAMVRQQQQSLPTGNQARSSRIVRPPVTPPVPSENRVVESRRNVEVTGNRNKIDARSVYYGNGESDSDDDEVASYDQEPIIRNTVVYKGGPGNNEEDRQPYAVHRESPKRSIIQDAIRPPQIPRDRERVFSSTRVKDGIVNRNSPIERVGRSAFRRFVSSGAQDIPRNPSPRRDEYRPLMETLAFRRDDP